MNNNTEQFIQDLICTSVIELIKTDYDVERLINNGLLKSIDNTPEINAREKIFKNTNVMNYVK